MFWGGARGLLLGLGSDEKAFNKIFNSDLLFNLELLFDRKFLFNSDLFFISELLLN